MAASRKISALDKRLRDIEREKARVREQLEEVRRWADSVPEEVARLAEPRLKEAAMPAGGRSRAMASMDALPGGVGVLERVAEEVPVNETMLELGPGPEGLDTKRVIMPRLERTDLLRPSIGGSLSASKLAEPEFDRFRNYFGSASLKRVRESRREQGYQRVRAIFMMVMVLMLGFILFKMLI